MFERLPCPLRRLFDWQRRRFFREEEWRITGPANRESLVAAVETVADDGLPLLLTLPKLPFNRPFVGRVRDRRIVLKHRTRPLIWPIGPGSYFFKGRIDAAPDGGVAIAGRYMLRPTLAVVYYAYLSIGFGLLGVSIIAAFGGAVAWASLTGPAPILLLSGLKMLAVSIAYIALGWLHIALEKWLDRGNRVAVRALLDRAAGR